MVDAVVIAGVVGLVLGFGIGGAIVWFFGDSKAYATGYEAGYLRAMSDTGDVIVRVRKEVLS